MKKKLAAGILSVALLVTGATTVFAATDTSKLGDVKALYQQMVSIQKQIVDKEVEAGAITSDQATSLKNAIDEREKLREQALDNGQVVSPGAGMGRGMGMGMGPGAFQSASGTAQGTGYVQGFAHRGSGIGFRGAQAQVPAPTQNTNN